MAKNPKYRHLYKLMKELRKEFPADLPIKLFRKKLTGFFGYTTKGKKYYSIYIDSRLNEDFATYILIHEILHCLSWDSQQIDHGIEWGKSYSRVYKFYEKRYLE